MNFNFDKYNPTLKSKITKKHCILDHKCATKHDLVINSLMIVQYNIEPILIN